MSWNIGRPGWRLSIALAAFVALAGPAIAEDAAGAAGDAGSTGHGSPVAPAPGPLPYTVTIPTVTAVGSSIDEATLKAILAGDIAAHADELASLSATSIDIPEMHVNYSFQPTDGEPVTTEVVFHDIALANVSGGIAQTLSIGGTDTSASTGGTAKFGKMSAELFDIGGLLSLYGLVKAPTDADATRKLIYQNFTMEGGTITGPGATCTIRGATAASFKARPLKVSLVDFLGIAQRMQKNDEQPAPEDIAKFVDFYSDLLDAIEVSPIKFAGFDCSATTTEGKPVAIGVGDVTVGVFGGGRYPDVSARDLKITAEGDGVFSLGEVHFKGFDVSGPLNAVKAAGGAIDQAWLSAHYRELIPPFEGFAFSDFKIDAPDDKNPGERIKATIENFDLSLSDYLNGVPTDVSSMASHIVYALPETSADSSIKQLLDLGIHSVDVGYDIAVKWDEAANEIRLSRFSLTGTDMGSIAVASVIGQATRDLFSPDTDAALAAAMGLTLKRVDIDVKDAGLADLVLKSAAAAAGKDIPAFRQAISGMAQATILVFMGGAANANEVSTAVGNFVNGAKSLSITAVANDAAGITFDQLSALKDDPGSITDKVTIDAVAK